MTLGEYVSADLVVQNAGSVVMLKPMTKDGAVWLHDNVAWEPWQWLGNSLACEPRMVQDVIDGATADGLVVVT